MPKYVALLRGIAPANPNMRNEKLRDFFESLGFSNVRTVISSGNVLFESGARDIRKLETKIETALPEKLGFHSTVIIRSHNQLKQLITRDAFTGMTHSPKTSLNVTFLKQPRDTDLRLPYRSPDRSYTVLGIHHQAVCSVVDLTGAKTPDLMAWLEKQFGKQITTRTWNTVQKIVQKLT